MALDAAQIEALRNGIGDAFSFGDLDLLLRKCFGSARINDITSATQPTRLIAQECIALVEQESVTVVFLRYIMLDQKCPQSLRDTAIGIFPELKTADQKFSDVVASAADNLQRNAAQIAEKVASKAPIQLLTDSISDLRCYKSLHEALHQIQISGRPQVPDDDSPRSQQEFRREMRQYVALLRAANIKANDALAELPQQSGLNATEKPWIDSLGNCAARLQAALTGTDLATAEVALDVTSRTIDPLPDQINRHIFDIAQKLPLDRLLDALNGANDAATSATIKQATDSIAALRLALLTRVLEHSRWQETDNALFSLDLSFKEAAAKAFKKFVRQWPPARKQIEVLIGADKTSDWAVTIQGFAGSVDHALAEAERLFTAPVAGNDDPFNSVVFEPYDTLRQEARTRFFTVDSALKHNCLELLRIQAPLATISAGITS